MKKTFVIGDIHGCYQSLLSLLAKIDANPDQDRLIFLGDYLDRGPDSKKVITKILDLKKKFPYLITLSGNHEQMFLDFLHDRNPQYLKFGGQETLVSYGLTSRFSDGIEKLLPADHHSFLNNLLSYWEDENFIYVHAGLEPGIHLSRQSTQWLFWARENFLSSDYDFGKQVIFGHTQRKTPLLEKNKIGIDTGAVYGGRLTCLVLPDKEFISVDGL